MVFAYIIWRAVFTLNLNQPVSSYLFLFTDLIAGIASTGFVLSMYKPVNTLQILKRSNKFTVDVWIPTINEDIGILSRTIRHCLSLSYPHNTYVLDDGNRDDVKSLVMKLGASYICRDSNENAKAGNLNNALKYTSGDLIAIFDADFVPQKISC